MSTPMSEAIEHCTETAKDLMRKWRAYGSDVAGKLDSSSYKADNAATDLAKAVSLAIETGVRLSLEPLNAMSILGAEYVEDEKAVDLTTQYAGATLELAKLPASGFTDVPPLDNPKIIPSQLGPGQQAFKVRVNIKGRPAGIYDGSVRATAPTGQVESVSFSIEVP